MFRNGLIFLILLLQYGCTSDPAGSVQSVELSPSTPTKVSVQYMHKLTNQSHVSNGMDLYYDGRYRFEGPMGAHGVTYNGYQYIVYYSGKDRSLEKSNAKVLVARRNLSTNQWQNAQLQAYTIQSDNGHNRSAIGISEGDGTIHIAFDHYQSKRLHYARSIAGAAHHPDKIKWDNSVFHYQENLGLNDKLFLSEFAEVTFPTFLSTQDGNLLLQYQGGKDRAGLIRFANYNHTKQAWDAVIALTSPYGSFRNNSATRIPYTAGGIQYDPNGALKLAWLFREAEGGCAEGNESKSGVTKAKGCNHGLYFAKSYDSGVTWLDKDKRKLANTKQAEQISIDMLAPVTEVAPETYPSNVAFTSAVDPATGDMHVLLQHKNVNKEMKVHHYVIREDGTWLGGESTFSASNVTIAFKGDHAFAFGGRKNVSVHVASRGKRFNDWHKLDLSELPAEDGYSTWDLSRLEHGTVSLIWHKQSKALLKGEPSPITVFDLKLTP